MFASQLIHELIHQLIHKLIRVNPTQAYQLNFAAGDQVKSTKVRPDEELRFRLLVSAEENDSSDSSRPLTPRFIHSVMFTHGSTTKCWSASSTAAMLKEHKAVNSVQSTIRKRQKLLLFFFF